LDFSFFGDGSASTELYAQNGRVLAAATKVNGALSAFETGTQMENTINAALSNIPRTEYVEQISIAQTIGGNVLTYVVR
ncbi:MAG TPA: hypothetical protein VKQ36_11540, partial [Ktedonobacterales bacterium]|nr:hypothetical protein [Ktedonobacterales bacterium]